MTALVFDQVGFAYDGPEVLADLSFEVPAGSGIALFGPNGAGKTTVTRLAMGLLSPLAGTVRTAGRNTAGLGPEDLADVAGYLFQDPASQLVERSVTSEVAFGPRCLGWDASRTEDAGAAVLAELDLQGEAATHPYDLPLPQRRLVALASAVVGGPALLLLDEPTAGLDRRSRHLVIELVRRRIAQGVAVLAVTHDPGFAVECLDHAMVLERGAIQTTGPVQEVLLDGGSGLPVPPTMRLAQALQLTPDIVRGADVTRALAERCRGSTPNL